MGKMKRIFAWLLSLAMVFGLLGGQVSVVKAAGYGIYSYTLDSKELPSEGGELVATIKFDDFSTTDSPIYYQLKKDIGDYNWEIVKGYENVEGQVVGNKLKVNIPANKETTEVKYKLIVNLTSGQFENSWGGMEQGAKRASFTVAAANAGSEEEKVLSDETTFRAKVVDENGAPVEGVKLVGKDESFGNEPEFTSNANGVAEYEIEDNDITCIYTIRVSEDGGWTSENRCTFEVGHDQSWSPIISKINGKSINQAGEIKFVVKKAAADDAQKVALKAVIDEVEKLNKDNYTSKSWAALQQALTEAKTVYENKNATTAQIATAKSNLETAKKGLVEMSPERKALEAKVAEAKKFDYSLYTDESKAKVMSAVAEAEKLADNASVEEIKAAQKNIEDAMEALKKVPSWDSANIGVSRDKLTSKGGTVELRLAMDNYGADEGTIYYRVRKKTITPEGYPMWDEVQTNVPTQISKENPIIKVTLPENTTEKEEEYQITPTSKKGTYTNLKGVSVTVIPASQDEEYTNNSAFSTENVYRVKAVDAEGVPVEGVEFKLTADNDKTRVRNIVTNNKGVAEYEINPAEDCGSTYNVTVADDTDWVSSVILVNAHNFTVSEGENAVITSIDGFSVESAGDVRIAVKKNPKYDITDAAKMQMEKVLADAEQKNEADFTKESWNAYKEAVDAAKAISEKVAGAERVTAADYQNAIQAVKDAEAALVKAEAPKPEPEVKKVASVKLAKTSYVYDGKVKKPAVVAKNNKGEKITSKDYTVKYAAGCKNVGTYTVKVTFKGDYKGTFTKTFNINPKGTSLSKVKAARKSFSATWKKQSKQTSGYQLQYSTNKKFAKAVKTSTISKNTTVKKTVKKLSAKKTYYVRVRTYKTVKVGKKSVKIYSGWSAAKKVKTK